MKQPTSSYLICATPRTGSTLLCDLLRSTGAAGIPREYFNRGFVPYNRARWRANTDAKYYAALMRHGLTRNGVFASKIMFAETRLVEAIIRAAFGLPELPPTRDAEGNPIPQDPWDPDPEVLAQGLPNLRYVWIRRQDTARQAISYFTARTTKLWSWQGEHWEAPEVPEDFKEIAHQEYHLIHGDRRWEEWFPSHGITPHTVIYEELSANPAREANRVLEFLGLRADIPPSPTLKKQAGSRSEELYQKYMAARAAGEIEPWCPGQESAEETKHETEIPA